MTQLDVHRPVSTVQYRSLLIASAFGAGILTLPRYLVGSAGQDGWMVPLPAAVIGLVCVLLSLALLRRFPGKDVGEIFRAVLPRGAAAVLLGAYSLFSLGVAAVSLRWLARAVEVYLLPNTPLWAVTAAFLPVIFYAVCRGNRPPARFSEVTRSLLLITLILLLSALPRARLTDLMPAFTASPGEILSGIAPVLYTFSFTVLPPVFLPLVRDRPRAEKLTAYAVGAVGLIFAALTAACIAVLGSEGTGRFFFPVIMLYKTVPVPIISRLDLFFLTFWIILAVRPCINFTYASLHYAVLAFPRLLSRSEVFAGAICFILGAACLCMSDLARAEAVFLHLGYFVSLMAGVIPGGVLLLSVIRKRRAV